MTTTDGAARRLRPDVRRTSTPDVAAAAAATTVVAVVSLWVHGGCVQALVASGSDVEEGPPCAASRCG